MRKWPESRKKAQFQNVSINDENGNIPKTTTESLNNSARAFAKISKQKPPTLKIHCNTSLVTAHLKIKNSSIGVPNVRNDESVRKSSTFLNEHTSIDNQLRDDQIRQMAHQNSNPSGSIEPNLEESFPDPPFTRTQLADAIQFLGKSSPGFDDIHPIFLKHTPLWWQERLYRLFSLCYNAGVLPRQWKIGRVITLVKDASVKTKTIDNLRPICITSIIIRLFERLMYNVIDPIVRPEINKNQAGFSAGRSTLENIQRLNAAMVHGLQTRRVTPFCFVDISKAFDTVPHDQLLSECYNLGIKDKNFMWLCAFLNSRFIRVVRGNEKSDLFSIETGTPQGSVLSPLLFLIFINTLLNKIQKLGTVTAFADDIMFTPKYDNKEKNHWPRYIKIMNNMLYILYKWSVETQMAISLKKTEIIISHNKRQSKQINNKKSSTKRNINKSSHQSSNLRIARRKRKDPQEITASFWFGNQLIPLTKKYTYLGVEIQWNGSSTLHRQNTLTKLRKSAWMVNNLVGDRTSPPQAHIIFLVARALLFGIALYAASTYDLNPTYCKQVDNCLTRVLKHAQGVANCSNSYRTLADFGMPKFEILAAAQLLKFINQTLAIDDEARMPLKMELVDDMNVFSKLEKRTNIKFRLPYERAISYARKFGWSEDYKDWNHKYLRTKVLESIQTSLTTHCIELKSKDTNYNLQPNVRNDNNMLKPHIYIRYVLKPYSVIFAKFRYNNAYTPHYLHLQHQKNINCDLPKPLNQDKCTNPSCINVVADLNHLLIHCPKYSKERNHLNNTIKVIQHTTTKSKAYDEKTLNVKPKQRNNKKKKTKEFFSSAQLFKFVSKITKNTINELKQERPKCINMIDEIATNITHTTSSITNIQHEDLLANKYGYNDLADIHDKFNISHNIDLETSKSIASCCHRRHTIPAEMQQRTNTIRLLLQTDGASKNNGKEGYGGLGGTIKDADDPTREYAYFHINAGTGISNNVAEYCAFIYGMQLVLYLVYRKQIRTAINENQHNSVDNQQQRNWFPALAYENSSRITKKFIVNESFLNIENEAIAQNKNIQVSLSVELDSNIIVNHMQGSFNVNQDFIIYNNHAHVLSECFEQFNIKHIPRVLNKRADFMSNLGIIDQLNFIAQWEFMDIRPSLLVLHQMIKSKAITYFTNTTSNQLTISNKNPNITANNKYFKEQDIVDALKQKFVLTKNVALCEYDNIFKHKLKHHEILQLLEATSRLYVPIFNDLPEHITKIAIKQKFIQDKFNEIIRKEKEFYDNYFLIHRNIRTLPNKKRHHKSTHIFNHYKNNNSITENIENDLIKKSDQRKIIENQKIIDPFNSVIKANSIYMTKSTASKAKTKH
jgi:ribonuclease HI